MLKLLSAIKLGQLSTMSEKKKENWLINVGADSKAWFPSLAFNLFQMIIEVIQQ